MNFGRLAVAVLLSVVLGAANFILFLWLAVHKLIPPPVVYSPGLLLGLGLIQVPLEEFIFRGLLLRYLARVNWLLGLVVSSAAFALGARSLRRIACYPRVSIRNWALLWSAVSAVAVHFNHERRALCVQRSRPTRDVANPWPVTPPRGAAAGP